MKKWQWISVGSVLIGAVIVLVTHRQSVAPVPAEPPKASVPVSTARPSVEPAVPVADIKSPPVVPVGPKVENTATPVLSDAVKTLLSTNVPFTARAQIIQKLSRDLSADDVTALRNFLNAPPSDFPGTKPIALNSLKNDVLEVLMDQRRMPEGLGQQVVDLFNNSATDYMWKEYCLQFMAPFVEQQLKDGAVPEANGQADPKRVEIAAVTHALYAALDDRGKDLAGTALLGLDRLAKAHGQFDRKAVLVKAVEIAKDPKASAVCRLTAMRVASSGGNADVLPAARELAQTGQTDLLRGAAITTLGDFGAPEDMELLKTLSASPNRQIAVAAQSALKRRSP